MKNSKKLYTLLVAVILVLAFSSCSKGKKDNQVQSSALSDPQVIESNYDSAIEDIKKDEYEKISSGENYFTDNFTLRDFQFAPEDVFTDPDGNVTKEPINVRGNEYAIITPQNIIWGPISSESYVVFEGAAKNDSKDFGFMSTIDDILNVYNLTKKNIVYSETGSTVFAFASDDNEKFTALAKDDVNHVWAAKQKSKNAAEALDHKTVALVNVIGDENGILSQYEIYYYSADEKNKFDH